MFFLDWTCMTQLSESLNSEKPLIFELHLKNNLWDFSDALKITVSL